MTATLPLGPSRAKPRREMPVLFHLLDVSQPKGYAAPPECDLPPPAASSLPAEFSAPLELPPLPLEVASPVVAPPIVGSESTPSAEVPAANPPAATATTTTTPESEAVLLRQRMKECDRKRQTPESGNWFASHGKYIAILFVLGLIGTVYLARTRRTPAPPASPHAHPGAAADPSNIAIEMPKAKSQPNQPDKSIATATEPQPDPEQPRTELQPPSAAPAVVAETPAKPSDEGLFPWKDREEVRVATRPDPPALAPGPESPAAASPAPTNYGPAPAPSLEPQYPVTGGRQFAPPSTSQYQPASPPSTSPPPSAPPVYAPARPGEPVYPTTNSARGTRYERTGSGLY
ncbi:MAG: hypothetical protein SFU86_02860 [Pirellulaceae bacterium]|nr:hypothetical protein [Pirellulaceae bacterium]